PASVSSATLTAVEGNPVTAADEGDLALSLNATDVRSAAGGDYDPSPSGADVTLKARLRVSDTYNGASLQDPATVDDLEFQVPASCASSAGPQGSTCSINT